MNDLDGGSKKLLAAAKAITAIDKKKEKADENEAIKEVRKTIKRRAKEDDEGKIADKVIEKDTIKEIKK